MTQLLINHSDARTKAFARILSDLVVPPIGTFWASQGGVYAGAIRGGDGKPNRHIIVPKSALGAHRGISWGAEGQEESGAKDEFDGMANTIALLNSRVDHPAAKWASGLVIDGHKDFYLPARRELALCHANVFELFAKEWYWSSTQHSTDSGYAWVQGFDRGYQSYDGKSSSHRACAVRSLTLH